MFNVDPPEAAAGPRIAPQPVKRIPGPASHPRWVLPLILLTYLGMYARTFSYGFIWDDPMNFSATPLMEGPLSQVIRKGEHSRADPSTERMPHDLQPAHESYRPLSILSHWLDVHWFGHRPGPMHVHQILLGLVSILLVHALGRTLFLGPWLAGLWALHPLHVEVFAYLSARSDLLAAIFSLLALGCAFRSSDAKRPAWRWFWAAGVGALYLLSVFSKEANVGLPFAVLALAIVRGKTRATIPTFAVLAASTIIFFFLRTVLMQAASLGMTQPHAVLRALGETPGVVLAYTVSFFSPFSLSVDRTFWAGYVPLGWVALAIMLAAIVLLRRRSFPILIAGSLSALYPLLAPSALSIRSIGALSDRYVFFPFLFIAISVLAAIQWGAAFAYRIPPWLKTGTLVFLGLICLVVTGTQVSAWTDPEALARHAVAMDPTNSFAHYRLSTVFTAKGNFAGALPHLEQSVALDPSNQRAMNNLSVIYLNLGRVAEAKAILRKLLPFAGSSSRRFWYNVASVQAADGKLDKACSALSHALEIDPRYALALDLRDRICVPSKP